MGKQNVSLVRAALMTICLPAFIGIQTGNAQTHSKSLRRKQIASARPNPAARTAPPVLSRVTKSGAMARNNAPALPAEREPFPLSLYALQSPAKRLSSAAPDRLNSVSALRQQLAEMQQSAAFSNAVPDFLRGIEDDNAAEEAGTDDLDSYLYYLEQRAYPYDTIDWDAYPRALAQRDSLPPALLDQGVEVEPNVLASAWTFIGPANLQLPAEPTPYFGTSPVSGRVNAVLFDSRNATTYYVGARGGGVWKTADGGTTWASLTDKRPEWKQLSVSSLALDPSNPDILYAGTGDFDGRVGYSQGLMKSTNGGATWTAQGVNDFGPMGDNVALSAVVVSPDTVTDPMPVGVNRPILAAGGRGGRQRGGIWRSADNGANWEKTLDTINEADGTETFLQVCELAAGPQKIDGTRSFFASGYAVNVGAANALTYSGRAWRSNDYGKTWQQIWLDTYPANPAFANQMLRIAPSPNAISRVYMLDGYRRAIRQTDNAQNNGGGAMQGVVWANITGAFPNGNAALGATYNWSQAYADLRIFCTTNTTNNRDSLYVGLIDLVRGDNAGPQAWNWTSIGRSYTATALLHNDQHAIAVHPRFPDYFLFGNDGGVYLHDASVAPVGYRNMNAALPITEAYHAVSGPGANQTYIVSGAQDNGSPTRSEGNSVWRMRNSGDGGFCAIWSTDRNVQYTTTQSKRTPANMKMFQCTYTNDNWAGKADVTANVGNDRIAFLPPIAVDSNNVFYFGTNFLWRGFNGGVWNPMKTAPMQSLSAAGYIAAIAIAPSDNAILYTGSNRGEVWMSRNSGANWTQIGVPANPPVPAGRVPNRAITSVKVNPGNRNEILVAFSGTGAPHLYRCPDTTANPIVWNAVSGAGMNDLPDIPANAVAYDLDDPNNVWYVGTDIGAFQTTNAGGVWRNATQPLGLPNVQVNDLFTTPRTLTAATFGRGVWTAGTTAAQRAFTFTLSGNTLRFGQSLTGTLILTSPLPAPFGGTTFALVSSDPALVPVPDSITITYLSKQTTFQITASGCPPANTPVTITATQTGLPPQNAMLTVQKCPQVAGIITLQDCLMQAQPITFTFRPADGSPAFVRNTTLAADGSFTLTDIPFKTYNLAVKGAKWLQVVKPLDMTQGNVANFNVTLPGADANNDNQVDVADLAALVAVYGDLYDPFAANPPANDVRADFNCDGSIDVFDFALLVNNFELVGDN